MRAATVYLSYFHKVYHLHWYRCRLIRKFILWFIPKSLGFYFFLFCCNSTTASKSLLRIQPERFFYESRSISICIHICFFFVWSQSQKWYDLFIDRFTLKIELMFNCKVHTDRYILRFVHWVLEFNWMYEQNIYVTVGHIGSFLLKIKHIFMIVWIWIFFFK